MTYPWVGISGPAGSGKDTAGDYLVEHYGYVKVKFATALRDLASKINPLVEQSFLGTKLRFNDVIARDGYEQAKAGVPEVRRFLQELGTNCRDTFGENVWVDRAIQQALTYTQPVVFTDVRFDNEAEAIWYEGPSVTPFDYTGINIRLQRDVAAIRKHVSESGLSDEHYDIIVNNDDTIETLYGNLDHILTHGVDSER